MSLLSYESDEHFIAARRQARGEQIWRWLTRKPSLLLSFPEVQKLLGLRRSEYRGREDIEIARVVGTTGRQRDFTRAFRPQASVQRDRWRAIDDMMSREGFQPIEVYQVSTVYFVLDGHHRVSVAKAHNLQTIEASINSWPTSIHIDAADSIEQLQARLSRVPVPGYAEL